MRKKGNKKKKERKGKEMERKANVTYNTGEHKMNLNRMWVGICK